MFFFLNKNELYSFVCFTFEFVKYEYFIILLWVCAVGGLRTVGSTQFSGYVFFVIQ